MVRQRRGPLTGGTEEPSSASPHLVRRIAASFRPYWLQVSGIAFLILITAGVGVINPLLIREVFDDGLFPAGGPNLQVLWILAGIMGGVTVVSGALGIVQTFFTNRVGQRVMRDLRDNLYRHLQTLSLGFHRPPAYPLFSG